MGESSVSEALKIVVIGAGIGGLVCAIACRRGELPVVVLEKTTEILPVSIS